MKKVVAMLLAAIMVIGLFAGCGSSNSGSSSSAAPAAASNGTEKVNLKVWVPEEEMEITQQLTAAFNEAHPEFDIT